MHACVQGLVEEDEAVPLSSTNYLTLNRVYSRVGNTRILQADPGVLNFGGFAVGKVHRQTLRIRNVKASGTRIHILPPSTPYFKVSMHAMRPCSTHICKRTRRCSTCHAHAERLPCHAQEHMRGNERHHMC